MSILALWNVGKFKKLRAEKFKQLSNKETTATMMTKTDKFFYSELDGKFKVEGGEVLLYSKVEWGNQGPTFK